MAADHRTSKERGHTPGPWHVYEKNPLCVESPGGNIALVNLARASEADARLIAAAPDLLAVCKEMAESWSLLCECGEPTCKTVRLRAAIAKAEGRV